MFNDLKNAILDLLKSADRIDETDEEMKHFFIVPEKQLKILQSEYNIYFVEPNDKQVEIINDR